MTLPRLNRIEIQGFRSFGQARQILDLSESVSVLWGGNSQGKTSFAEALEFLFTGQTARRDLLASTKDEFTEALRNAHVLQTFPVVVEAHVACVDGKVRRLTRTLVEDYRRGNPAGCVSRLEIDGKLCVESDLGLTLGIHLSHPPLRAPVLAQHTLAYLFSVSPTERATYFRAILDTQDIEAFRAAVAALKPLLTAPVQSELDDLAAIEAIPAVALIAVHLRKAKTEVELRQQLLANNMALLISIAISPLHDLTDQAACIDEEVQRRRAQTFPLHLFGRSSLSPWTGSAATVAGHIETFLVERAKIDAQTRRLADLFKAALLLPTHPTDHGPIDCPLCGAIDSFTFDRVEFIRERLKETEAYAKASHNFQSSLQSLDREFDALALTVGRAQPRFMHETAASRRLVGFTVEGIAKLVHDPPTVKTWLDTVRPLWRTSRVLKQEIQAARTELRGALSNPELWNGKQSLDEAIALVVKAYGQAEAALLAYEAPAKALGEVMKAAVDQSADTKGWEALARVSRNPAALWEALEVTARMSSRSRHWRLPSMKSIPATAKFSTRTSVN